MILGYNKAMSRAVLVTGINGFVGQHLARELHDAGCVVMGIGQENAVNPLITGIVHKYFQCDLTDQAQVNNLPWDAIDAVINLAGLANVAASFDNPDLYMKVNVGTLTTICKRLMELQRTNTRVLAISTGAVYDSQAQPPFDEQSPVVSADKRSPYVESKLRMEAEARKFRQQGLQCIIVRPFNHIGPGQLTGFLLPDLDAQVRHAIEAGTNSIMVGNLANKRDFTDVRDVVRAYRLLATIDASKLKHDTYNVCSGTPVAGQALLDILIAQHGIGGINIVTDQAKIRPTDPASLYGNHDTLTADCGWQPEIPLEQTVADFVAASKTA